MKTQDSKADQNISADNDTFKEVSNKAGFSVKSPEENSSDKELRIVDEKGMIGQPMGNRIQNSNYKHQTPTGKNNENNFSEGDSNSMKEQQQLQTPPVNVIESIKKRIGKA